MLLVVDGPEKAGKSTLIRRIEQRSKTWGWTHTAVVHLRYPLDPKILVKAFDLATRDDLLVVLDRSWASDVVYGRLVRGHKPPTVPEWWYAWAADLPAMTLGARVVVLPPCRLATLEDDDHPVPWETERDAFLGYATKWGWTVVDPLRPTVVQDVGEAVLTAFHAGERAPKWSGDRCPSLVWVGEARNPRSRDVLAWGPLTSRFWRKEVEQRLDEVLSAWPAVAATNLADVQDPKALFRCATTVVAYGTEAWKVLGPMGAQARPHPSYKHRWGPKVTGRRTVTVFLER